MNNELIKKLENEREMLKKAFETACSSLNNAPEGSLQTNVQENTTRYYRYTFDAESDKNIRKYLGKKDADLIRRLAQKGYDIAVQRAAEQQIKVINRFLENYEPEKLKGIYSALGRDRAALIEAVELDDEEYVRRWEAVTYKPLEFEPDIPEYYTLKGERIRSKSEKIIADTLNFKNVPYRYEPPLILGNGKIKRPDFVVLKVRTREEYILEHLGMMDNPDYCERNIRKLQDYLQNNIFPGEKLILTAETSTMPLSVKDLDRIIEHYFI